MDGRIRLPDAQAADLSTLDLPRLRKLHWETERSYARLIKSTPRGSTERAAAVRDGYESVGRILEHIRRITGGTGQSILRSRDTHLVQQVLRDSEESSKDVAFFEIGFGRGDMLAFVAREGYIVGGIEVNPRHYSSTCQRLPGESRQNLLCGDFLSLDLERHLGGYDVVYWNQVLEHICPDDVADYLRRIHMLLRSGGKLITITPNWHVRPSDVTALFRPARAEAEGFHLKEYRLTELLQVLASAGFLRAECPIVVLPTKTFLWGNGLIGLKKLIEPSLEYVPLRLARKLAGGLGYYCTLATKGAEPS